MLQLDASSTPSIFQAYLTSDQVSSDPTPDSTATGIATLILTDAGLAYVLSVEGVDLVPESERTPEGQPDAGPNDVTRIHLHVGEPDTNGPHVLNIFGLPSEDDADLAVDFEANTLSGLWDDGDATDLNGDGDFNEPNESKLLSDFVEALAADGLYFQVHTTQFPNPGEIRGQVLQAQTVNFDAAGDELLAAGTVVSDQFADLGVTVSSTDAQGEVSQAMIFDTANPTGGDFDLASDTLGNVLIVSEDGDASDPDDAAQGGTLSFEFDELVGVASVGLLDIEELGGEVVLFDAAEAVIETIDIPALGNNSAQQLIVNAANVARVDVILAGSGAVSDISFLPAGATEAIA